MSFVSGCFKLYILQLQHSHADHDNTIHIHYQPHNIESCEYSSDLAGGNIFVKISIYFWQNKYFSSCGIFIGRSDYSGIWLVATSSYLSLSPRTRLPARTSAAIPTKCHQSIFMLEMDQVQPTIPPVAAQVEKKHKSQNYLAN